MNFCDVSIITRILICFLLSLQTIQTTSNVLGANFVTDIQPILNEYCYDCHGDGMDKGKVSLDSFKSPQASLADKDLWMRILKNVRSSLMPPSDKLQPTPEEFQKLTDWIKSEVFEANPDNPDPGRVTLRRLNRVEYQNTIRDLMGIEFRAYEEFPPDDTGFGFDNIGDVLTVSPLLMEKYMDAAEMIVKKAVPVVPLKEAEQNFGDQDWQLTDSSEQADSRLSFYDPASIERRFEISIEGDYVIHLEQEVRGDFNFDPGQCEVTVMFNGSLILETAYQWQNRKSFRYEFPVHLTKGTHHLQLSIKPLKPVEEKKNNVDLRLASTIIRGPATKDRWVQPDNYARFFHLDQAPVDGTQRQAYAEEVLKGFTYKAYRRPVSDQTIQRLMAIVETTWAEPNRTFEQGIAEAMKAILASPYFVFRVEEPLPDLAHPDKHPFIDPFALASRLSYFIWATMPDAPLLELAREGQLREQWSSQVERALNDPRADAWIRSFVGQWLQTRDIESVALNSRAILARESKEERELDQLRNRYFELRRKPEDSLTESETTELATLREQRRRFFSSSSRELDGGLRRAMRQETEMTFEYIVNEDRSVLELLDSDYTFLNESLANHYGIENVEGRSMRKVILPKDNPRGGILTQGAFLAVTSNPTRTSPVKRGLFILDNLLGTPTPPPPEDVPDLEEAAKFFTDKEPTLRETLEFHRSAAICRSCHQRMDPLGLALENFNALGLWRDQEYDQPITPNGQLSTGETFSGINELKTILTTRRQLDFYRCLTEKLLTFALGRGLDYRDVETVDQIVDQLNEQNGRFSALLNGILESAPFQRRQSDETFHAQIRSSNQSAQILN